MIGRGFHAHFWRMDNLRGTLLGHHSKLKVASETGRFKALSARNINKIQGFAVDIRASAILTMHFVFSPELEESGKIPVHGTEHMRHSAGVEWFFSGENA